MPKLVLRRGDPTARQLMHTPAVRIHEHWSAAAAREAVASAGADDVPGGIVVIDCRGRFVGLVNAVVLAEAAPDAEVRTLEVHPPYTAKVESPLEDLAIAMDRYHVDTIPVLSGHGRPIGIVTAPSVLAAIIGLTRPAPAESTGGVARAHR